MRHSLVPDFILERAEARQTEGSFTGCTLFIDVSGFTAMTQLLMMHGKQGSEVLASIINTVFAPIVDLIYGQGGMVTGF
ncbi:MAG TPA: hypothetical protein VLL52_11375, partial [Anaerolineae bacterium]|nr:hypothetical protein [Anaerolineae bacterium]